MFDILAYLYDTYCRLEACPAIPTLVKKLAGIGFSEKEISQTVAWLTELVKSHLKDDIVSDGFRIYTSEEQEALGNEAIGWITFLESASILNANQREILIERALACPELPVSLEHLRIMIHVVLWCQGKECDMALLDEVMLNPDEMDELVLH